MCRQKKAPPPTQKKRKFQQRNQGKTCRNFSPVDRKTEKRQGNAYASDFQCGQRGRVRVKQSKKAKPKTKTCTRKCKQFAIYLAWPINRIVLVDYLDTDTDTHFDIYTDSTQFKVVSVNFLNEPQFDTVCPRYASYTYFM